MEAAKVRDEQVSEADLREAEVGFLRLLRARLGARFANEHAEGTCSLRHARNTSPGWPPGKSPATRAAG